MNEESEKQILDALREQTRILKETNRDNRIGMITAAIVLIGFLLSLPLHQRLFSRLARRGQTTDSWDRARALHSEGRDSDAEAMAGRLVEKYPDDYYGHTLLGYWQQRVGKLKEAEAEYTKAYELFPSEENEKTLAAIRKAIENKSANEQVDGTR